MFGSKRIRNAVAACLIVGVCHGLGTANAQETIEAGSFWHEDWHGSAFLYKSTKEFKYCMVDVIFEPDIFFGFIYDREGLALLLASKNWDFETETPFPITLDLDSKWRQDGIAYPSRSNKQGKWYLEIPFENSSAAMEKFRNGRRFTIASSKKTLRFQLAGTSGALKKLSDCYRTYGTPAGKPARR